MTLAIIWPRSFAEPVLETSVAGPKKSGIAIGSGLTLAWVISTCSAAFAPEPRPASTTHPKSRQSADRNPPAD